jgi:hypothetical protein
MMSTNPAGLSTHWVNISHRGKLVFEYRRDGTITADWLVLRELRDVLESGTIDPSADVTAHVMASLAYKLRWEQPE